MSVRVLALAAVLVVAGCSNSAAPADLPDTIAHAHGEQDVVIQVGGYELGRNVDGYVWGPQVVIYGNGDVYAELMTGVVDGIATHRLLRAHLDERSLQALLESASRLPRPGPTETGPADGVPTVLTVIGSTYSLNFLVEPYASFMDEVRSAAADNETGEWVPDRWITRDRGDARCTVTDAPGRPGYDAPVYPHLLDDYPLGELDCVG